MITYVLFFVGFAALVKGADLLVAGASSLAARFGVSTVVIGLTIVAFGTSVPELIVNLLASYNGNTDIAIGNVLGSNIANIFLILGVSAIIYPLAVGRGTVYKEIPFALLAVIALGLMANDALLDGATTSAITRSDGFLLLAFFSVFLVYIFMIAQNGSDQSEEPTILHSRTKSIFLVLLGIIGLVVGGKWIVDGAVAFATNLGVSEAMIGLTVVAVGTSLPELATSAVAAYRRNVDIAVGNIVGSNIFNIFWILGVSAVISPLPFGESLQADLGVTFLASAILFGALAISKHHTVQRWHGVTFLLLYVLYISYVILRG